MTLIFTEAAQFSHLLAALAVLFSLFFMLCMIYRLDASLQSSSVTYVAQSPLMPQPMQPVHNPFHVKLEKSHSSTLKNGVLMKISSQADSIMRAFWGVTINDFYQTLSVSSTSIAEQLLGRTFLSESCLLSEDFIRLPCQTDYHYELETPESIVELELKPPPRTEYPLVLVIAINKDLQDIPENDIIAMAVVIHLKDEACSMESQILLRYLKRRSGEIFRLKNLYVEDPSTEDDGKLREKDNSTNSYNYLPPDCVICQSKPISHALLPCRHTCVCESCFTKLENRCPMCRCRISTYFRISNDETETELQQQ